MEKDNILNKFLLMSKYDVSKTLNENQGTIIVEQSTAIEDIVRGADAADRQLVDNVLKNTKITDNMGNVITDINDISRISGNELGTLQRNLISKLPKGSQLRSSLINNLVDEISSVKGRTDVNRLSRIYGNDAGTEIYQKLQQKEGGIAQPTNTTTEPPVGATTIGVTPEPPPQVTQMNILTPQQIQQAEQALNMNIIDVVNGRVTVGQLQHIGLGEIQKMQELFEANKNLLTVQQQKLLNEKIQNQIAIQKALDNLSLTTQEQLDEIAIESKQLDTEGQKIDVRAKKIDLRQKKFQALKNFFGVFVDAKWKRIAIIAALVIIAAKKAGGLGILRGFWNWVTSDNTSAIASKSQPTPQPVQQKPQQPVQQPAKPKLTW